MKNGKLTHNEILMLLLYADNCHSITGKTRIQKIVYLYEEEVHEKIGFNKKINASEPSLFGFYPHHFGPFSDNLLKYLEELTAFNILKQEMTKDILDNNKLKQITKFTLTEIGQNYVKSKLLQHIDHFTMDILSNFKINYNNMIYNDLLYYVYNTYEIMTEKSLIKDQYLESNK